MHVRKAAHELLKATEQEQHENATGPLQWVVRFARVESQAVVRKLQQMTKHAAVAAAVLANHVLKYIKKTASREQVFQTGTIGNWRSS